MTGKTLFLATPTYDEWFCMEYASSLFETGVILASAGIPVYHGVAAGNPFIDLARNSLVDKFLASDATDLLFVDADVGWDAKVITRILSYEQEVVGGLVPKRDAKKDDVFHQNALTGIVSKEGLLQSQEIPTAFVKISRSVFEKMEKPYFKTGSNDKDFGEDIYFCRKLVKSGKFCWIDSDISFSHRGGKVWKGNFFDYALKSGLVTKSEAA